MTPLDPDEQRSASREMWEQAADSWGTRADRVRDWGMPVSVAMVDALRLQPGQRVLELAAGPGDTGFMAAELVAPGGTLISSDGADAMVEVARRRAAALGVHNVEFRQLELEWIDLEAASVDAVLCRWGIMLIVDPEAAGREIRRILRPGGRAAFAVWAAPADNPWATIPGQVMIGLGHSEPPAPGAPGMFSLAQHGQLAELLESCGFTDVDVQPVDVARPYERVAQFVEETIAMSPIFSSTYRTLSEVQQQEVVQRLQGDIARFAAADGKLIVPGRSLVAAASA